MLRDVKGARWVLVLVGLLITGLLVARNFIGTSPPAPGEDLKTVEASGAAEHVGETVRVCGRVAEASHVPSVEGRPTFLNFGAPHPDAVFTAVIWSEARARFEAPPEDLFGRREICVRGRVARHQGRPQIEVASPEQVEVPASDDGGGP